MPITIDFDGIWVGDGRGGMKRIEPTLTRIEIKPPGEHIVIEDEKGIVIEKNPVTGELIIHADSINIASEQKPRQNILKRLFGSKERG